MILIHNLIPSRLTVTIFGDESASDDRHVKACLMQPLTMVTLTYLASSACTRAVSCCTIPCAFLTLSIKFFMSKGFPPPPPAPPNKATTFTGLRDWTRGLCGMINYMVNSLCISSLRWQEETHLERVIDRPATLSAFMRSRQHRAILIEKVELIRL